MYYFVHKCIVYYIYEYIRIICIYENIRYLTICLLKSVTKVSSVRHLYVLSGYLSLVTIHTEMKNLTYYPFYDVYICNVTIYKIYIRYIHEIYIIVLYKTD